MVFGDLFDGVREVRQHFVVLKIDHVCSCSSL
jgi:hypothetical protein